MKKIVYWVLMLSVTGSLMAQNRVRIRNVRGDVKVRRGLEETWQRASRDMLLDEIDTILSGEDSEVTLVIEEGVPPFTLGSMSILDIADLRKITERDLFLFLMSAKINRIDAPDQPGAIHIENVSVVRADNKAEKNMPPVSSGDDRILMEVNGGRALFQQAYYPNAIVKFHRILEKSPEKTYDALSRFYLGKSFEAIDQSGRALDAYQSALPLLENSGLKHEALSAIERLKE